MLTQLRLYKMLNVVNKTLELSEIHKLTLSLKKK